MFAFLLLSQKRSLYQYFSKSSLKFSLDSVHLKKYSKSIVIPRSSLLNRSKNLGILIPRQQRILPTLRLRIPDISPALHELLMVRHKRQFPRDGAIQVLDHVEVGRKEDVKVALVDLSKPNQTKIISMSK